MREKIGGDPLLPSVEFATLGYKAQLWRMADALRGSMDAAEYKHVVLGLISLKYISDAFEEHRTRLEQELYADPEDSDEYRAENVFWVPLEALWDRLRDNARQPTIGQIVDEAMEAVERDNPPLKGVLPKDYARPALDKQRLAVRTKGCRFLGETFDMENGQLTWITNFIWGIADDVLRDLYVRGKYRDVILPMTVIRRLDAVLEPTKQAVLDMKATLDKESITNQDAALRQAAGQAFYNTSPFTLRDLKARANRQQLEADFRTYLDGFSPNVQEIIDNFEFRNQIPRLAKADALGTLIEKFLDPSINLSPYPVFNSDGTVRLPGLDNHAMGTIFEELVRRFNEENNEEAGEHWTPRDAVKLMARLILEPIAEQITDGTTCSTTAPAAPAGCSPWLRRLFTASRTWLNTSQLRNCATASRSPFSSAPPATSPATCPARRTSAPRSRRSCAARCCPTRATHGTTRPASRWATRSTSTATSTNPRRCARSRRSARTSWRWRRKRKGC
jgi:type I restriction-modification system DNA methylase subunit